jgi:probable rRNA maturation factor
LNQVRIDAAGKAGRALAPLVRRRARAYLKALRLDGIELSVSLVSDGRMRALNQQWRRKDKATDVLSFPQVAFSDVGDAQFSSGLLGDIVISTDTARAQARAYHRTLQQEVERYLAHGLLHLLGYDHHRREDRRRMAEAEEKLLGGAGMLER